MTRKMKDSGIEWIGEIPEEWSIRRLRFLCSITTGNKDTINAKDDGQYPFYVRSPKIEKIDTYSFDGEAVLTAGDGVGAGKVFHYVNGKFDYHQRVYNLHYFKNIKGKYVYYYLKENFIKEIEKSNAKSTVDSVRLPMLLNFPIVLPSMEEQNNITKYLDNKCNKIDQTIEKEKQVIEKLKEYKQSVITEAVTRGLNPDVSMKDSGVEWIGEIPEHWNIRRLRYLGICQNGISKSAEYFGSGYPFVSYGDVYKNMELPENVIGLVESSESDRRTYSVEKGDIFFTRTSETIEEIGLTCVCSNTIENATFAGFLIRVRPINKEDLNIGYSKYYFSSNMHRRFFVKEMNLVIRASLSQELLKKLPVLLPPIKEQQQIANYLDKKCSSIDKIISNKEKVIEKLTEYKKSLIYECVTGKRQVQ